MSAQRCPTWQDRLNDFERAPLKADFVESLVLTAHANQKTVEDLWVMWRSYEENCFAYDQATSFLEFCTRYQLKPTGPAS